MLAAKEEEKTQIHFIWSQFSKVIYGICSKQHRFWSNWWTAKHIPKPYIHNDATTSSMAAAIHISMSAHKRAHTMGFNFFLFSKRIQQRARAQIKNVSIYVIVFMMSERDSSLIRRHRQIVCNQNVTNLNTYFFEFFNMQRENWNSNQKKEAFNEKELPSEEEEEKKQTNLVWKCSSKVQWEWVYWEEPTEDIVLNGKQQKKQICIFNTYIDPHSVCSKKYSFLIQTN